MTQCHVNQNQHGSALDTTKNVAQKNKKIHYIYVYKYQKREKHFFIYFSIRKVSERLNRFHRNLLVTGESDHP